jgi:hypothetical protein
MGPCGCGNHAVDGVDILAGHVHSFAVTSATSGGDNLGTLYVTTASQAPFAA